jgi:hypothetical protein
LAYTPPASRPADFNKEGVISANDFHNFILADNVLGCAPPFMPTGYPADFNDYWLVDDADYQAFVLAYNQLVCS